VGGSHIRPHYARRITNVRIACYLNMNKRNVSLIVLGRYSPSQNGVIVSPFGLSPRIVGGGTGHDTDVPKILRERDL